MSGACKADLTPVGLGWLRVSRGSEEFKPRPMNRALKNMSFEGPAEKEKPVKGMEKQWRQT